MQMKMCLFAHQKVDRQVWIFSQYSLKMMTKLLAYLFVPITPRMHNWQFVWVKFQVTMQDAPNAPVRHASRLCVLTCRSPRTAADRHQHSGTVLKTADQVAFYTRKILLHDTALPIDGLHLEMELNVDSFHGEIHAESL